MFCVKFFEIDFRQFFIIDQLFIITAVDTIFMQKCGGKKQKSYRKCDYSLVFCEKNMQKTQAKIISSSSAYFLWL